MANAFKSGASQSRTTNDFNERAKLLSERLGAIEKPLQSKRSNAPRRSFKAGGRPEVEAEASEAPAQDVENENEKEESEAEGSEAESSAERN